MDNELHARIGMSRTSHFKVIFPNTTNHYNTLFGGKVLELMDEVAFISATRFSRKKVVTISSDKIDFKEPIPADTIVELVAQVCSVGTTSLQVRVEIFQEEMYRPHTRRRSITGQFTFVALDHNNKPTSVL